MMNIFFSGLAHPEYRKTYSVKDDCLSLQDMYAGKINRAQRWFSAEYLLVSHPLCLLFQLQSDTAFICLNNERLSVQFFNIYKVSDGKCLALLYTVFLEQGSIIFLCHCHKNRHTINIHSPG